MSQSTLALTGVDSTSTASLIQYSLRSAGENSVEYVGTNSTDTLAAPRILQVGLTLKNPGVTGNDRVAISAKQTVLDSLNAPYTGSATLSISIPHATQWTQAMTVSLLKQLADYCGGVAAVVTGQTDTSTFPAKLAAGIIP